jgi:para-nitrobenzyl esterase
MTSRTYPNDQEETSMTSVITRAGTVRGAVDRDVVRFLGIPFAEPPVGDDRWRPARPAAPWNGVRDATEFAPAPVQTAVTSHTPRGGQDEDCLYLNVWTPTLEPDEPMAVMVWIHGGGFLNGAASAPIYDGAGLAARGVVVVSLEYRLGAFGFLCDEVAGTNFGVTDWIVGLEWVHDNIAAFGGDPGCVTVFGQSAGAAATRALLSAPAARGLFHRAIIQSAGFEDYAVVGSPSPARSAAATAAMLADLGLSSVEQLRAVGTEEVRAASLRHSGIFPPERQVHTPANLTWYPVVDGDVITDGFDGWPAETPVMVGWTEHEARMFIRPDALYAHPEVRPEDAYTLDTLEAMAQALAGRAAREAVDELVGRGLTPYEALAELYTAAIWHEPALATLERFAELGRTVFGYRFARVAPGAEKDGSLADHASENPYVFGVLQPPDYYDEVDAGVSAAVQDAWIAFARTGVPCGPDGQAWPRFDPGEPRVAVIADRMGIEPVAVGPVTTLIHAQRVDERGAVS